MKFSGCTEIGRPDVSLDPHRIREVIFVGLGSSIAYALNELSDRFESAESGHMRHTHKPLEGAVSIIGKEDAWSQNVRGPGYINHQTEIIGQWGSAVPEYDPGYADRGEFEASNQYQYARAQSLGAEHIAAHAAEINRLHDGIFEIRLDDGQTILGRQVICGMGAGPNTSLFGDGDAKTLAESRLSNIQLRDPESLKGRVMELNEFMRESSKGVGSNPFSGRTVVVHGLNAGIDAVERAREVGAKVIWLIRNTEPMLLAGNQLKHAPHVAKASMHKVEFVDIELSSDKSTLKIVLEKGNKPGLKADYYVYALGQDMDKPGGLRPVLGPLTKTLEPIYDYDQVYSDRPFETVLGLQTKGADSQSGLIIIGAAVGPLAWGVTHTYLERTDNQISDQLAKMGIKANIPLDAVLEQRSLQALKDFFAENGTTHTREADLNVLHNLISHRTAARDYFNDQASKRPNGVATEVENQTKAEVASVVASAQLGTVKSSVAALTGLMPKYVANGENNYTVDNRTMLRAGIAQRYADITDEKAVPFIKEVISLRRQSPEAFALGASVTQAGTSSTRPVSNPVHGMPQHVRAAYQQHLNELNEGRAPVGPLSQLWVEQNALAA